MPGDPNVPADQNGLDPQELARHVATGLPRRHLRPAHEPGRGPVGQPAVRVRPREDLDLAVEIAKDSLPHRSLSVVDVRPALVALGFAVGLTGEGLPPEQDT